MLVFQGTSLLTRLSRSKVQDKRVSIEQADGKKKIFVIDPQPTIRLLATVRAIIRPASRPCVKWETLSLWWSQLHIFTSAQHFNVL